MIHYRVVKRVRLLVGKKEYRKDAVITAAMVGQDKIRRYLAQGYIAPLAPPPTDDAVEDAVDFLSPEQLDTLTKPLLLVYAKKIGVEGIPGNIGLPKLRERVDAFLLTLAEAEVEDEDDGDSGDTTKGGENASDDGGNTTNSNDGKNTGEENNGGGA